MRVVLATFGTEGDVSPFLTLGAALRERGHDVEVVTDRAHRAAVESRGLAACTPIARYDPVALTTDPRYAEPGLGPYRLFRDIFVPLVPELFHAVRASLERPTTVVLVHPWCHGALYAAESMRVPVASIAMAPLTWWSSVDPGFFSPHRPPPSVHRALARGPLRWGFDTFFGRSLARERTALGLPPLAEPFFALGREAEVAYGLWSPRFRGPAEDDPRGARICGYLGAARTSEGLAASLEAFLEAGPPPAVVGMGSLLPAMAGDVYVAARDAARALGRRVVLVGASPSLAAADVAVAPHAPYASLFRRAEAVVHHAGAGTYVEALRAARPAVAIPFGNDQFDNAVRLERLGVARSIPRVRLSLASVREALAWALAPEAAERARRVASELARERPAEACVVEDLERRFGARG